MKEPLRFAGKPAGWEPRPMFGDPIEMWWTRTSSGSRPVLLSA